MYKRLSRGDLLSEKEIFTRVYDVPLSNVNISRCEAFKQSVCYSRSVQWKELPPALRNTAL